MLCMYRYSSGLCIKIRALALTMSIEWEKVLVVAWYIVSHVSHVAQELHSIFNYEDSKSRFKGSCPAFLADSIFPAAFDFPNSALRVPTLQPIH